MANLDRLAELINLTTESMFSALKYVYSVSAEDFYNVSVKDIFKLALNDITDSECFENLGLKLEPSKIGEMATEEFTSVRNVIRYCLAVRIPFIRNFADKTVISNNDLKELYAKVSESGVANPDGIVELDFKQATKMVKFREDEPFFDAEWLKRWIYTFSKDLGAINNRNLFLLGCADAMFPLYYSTLTERMAEVLKTQTTEQTATEN